MHNDISQRLQYYTSNDRPYGFTYGQWTVKWWYWSLSIPKYINPVTDMSGTYASERQPNNNVWYLAGKVANEEEKNPDRHCKISASSSILFPVINCEISFLEYDQSKSESDLLHRVDAEIDTINMKQCVVDGESIPAQRIKSDPAVFPVQITKNNIYDIERGGLTTAAADGYWVFLKPLSPGEHHISFQGSCEYGKLKSGANYHLQIE